MSCHFRCHILVPENMVTLLYLHDTYRNWCQSFWYWFMDCYLLVMLLSLTWRGSAFFVTVRAGTAYRKIWRLDNNFFARIIRLTVQKFQFFWVIFCIIIFFHWIMHMLHFASELKWSRKMRLLSVFYFSFEISIACWLLSRPNWRIVSKLTIDVVTYCLQSKIKICVPENIVLQKKHCGLVINYHSICLLCTLLVCSPVMQY